VICQLAPVTTRDRGWQPGVRALMCALWKRFNWTHRILHNPADSTRYALQSVHPPVDPLYRTHSAPAQAWWSIKAFRDAEFGRLCDQKPRNTSAHGHQTRTKAEADVCVNKESFAAEWTTQDKFRCSFTVH